MSYLVADIETTTLSSFKRKANPFDPANWIVMAGWKGPTTKAECKRYVQADQTHSWLLPFLTDPASALLVGANIKFDVLHLLKDPATYKAWQAYVARGGNIWDIQLAEYLLDGQQQASHMLSLDQMAERYGGDLKVDEVKMLWNAGVPTEEIDPDLLTRYLIGEDLPNGERREGDIGNTELVFKKQLEKARKSGQVRSILLNMGALIATTEMERNGMFVDKALGLELAAKLEVSLAEAKERMAQYLPDLPFEFSWTNRYHLSPIVFGGQIKYQRREYTLKGGSTTWEPPIERGNEHYVYAQKDETHYVLEDGRTMECSWYEHLCSTEWTVRGNRGEGDYAVTYKGGKNAGEFKTKKVKVDDYTKPKSRMADCFWKFPGYTQPEEAWASSTDGLYSVSSEVIEQLGNRDIPFLKDLSSVKKMEKDLGTYYITWNEQKQEHVGMLTMVQPDSIIHHSLHHTSTVTGRFSSSSPNLQNLSKGNKSDVKTVFKSRFNKNYMMAWLSERGYADTHAKVNSAETQELLNGGGCIEQSDFSSLEVYIQAILTNCANLILDLKAGIDLHCMRLALKEHMEYGEVFNLCKGYTDENGVKHDAEKEWDYKRTGAKEFSFKRAYGAGAKSISVTQGMPMAEVEALIKAEQLRYPEIDTYFEARTEEIKASRIPIDRYVAHPEMPALKVQLGLGRVATPDGKKYTYNESPSPSFVIKRGGAHAGFSPTEIKNYEVQGEGGEWMKAALWLAVREFYRKGNFDSLSLLVNTVHDAAYADSHNSKRLITAVTLQACMEAASDFMEWWFNWPIPLPVPTDTVFGVDMGDEQKITDEEFRPMVAKLRSEIRDRYMAGYIPSYEKEKA